MPRKELSLTSEEVDLKSLAETNSEKLNKRENDIFDLHQRLLKEEKRTLSLAPQYQSYFGRVMTVGLSGINIYFPVDGRQYSVPKSYAAIIHERRRAVDDFLLRKNRMADVAANHESYMRELTF